MMLHSDAQQPLFRIVMLHGREVLDRLNCCVSLTLRCLLVSPGLLGLSIQNSGSGVLSSRSADLHILLLYTCICAYMVILGDRQTWYPSLSVSLS